MKACSQHLRSSCGDCLDKYKGTNYEIIVGDCFLTLQKFIDDGKKVPDNNSIIHIILNFLWFIVELSFAAK